MVEPKETLSVHVRDLRRGAGMHVFGHAARAAHPALLAVTTYLFGAERWGLLVAAQAALQVASRVALGGLDRGAVYWLAREETEPVLSGALLRVALGAGLLSLLGALWVAPALADLKGIPEDSWTILVWALVPLSLIDLLAYAATGLRRMEVLVVVRDIAVPWLFFGGAWVAFGCDAEETGLAWAFVGAQTGGFLLALGWCRRLIPRAHWGGPFSRLPDAFGVYAREMWGAAMAQSLLYRADTLTLAAFASPRVVGVYGVALQFGNTVRSLRGAFEPMVTAVASGLARQSSSLQLRESLTYATTFVLWVQLVVTMCVVWLGPWLLPLFGPGFDEAYVSAVVLCVGWTVHGGVALAAPVVMGFGKSRWTLWTSLSTVGVLAALLLVLTPRFGAEGTAAAVACAFVLQGLAYQWQARRLLGGALWTHELTGSLAGAGTALMLGGGTHLLVRQSPLSEWAPGAAFGVFIVALLPIVLGWMRQHASAGTRHGGGEVRWS